MSFPKATPRGAGSVKLTFRLFINFVSLQQFLHISLRWNLLKWPKVYMLVEDAFRWPPLCGIKGALITSLKKKCRMGCPKEKIWKWNPGKCGIGNFQEKCLCMERVGKKNVEGACGNSLFCDPKKMINFTFNEHFLLKWRVILPWIQLESLTVLSLHHNYITHLENVTFLHLSNLTSFDISFNRLIQLQGGQHQDYYLFLICYSSENIMISSCVERHFRHRK